MGDARGRIARWLEAPAIAAWNCLLAATAGTVIAGAVLDAAGDAAAAAWAGRASTWMAVAIAVPFGGLVVRDVAAAIGGRRKR